MGKVDLLCTLAGRFCDQDEFMRFEIFLTEIPPISAEKAKTELADLPKGMSAGIVTKAIQNGVLPAVAFAWSDDKGVINEIEDRIIALGGRCRVRDSGSITDRITTFVVERVVGRRYRKAENRTLIRLGVSHDDGNSATQAVLLFLLKFVLQLAVVEGLLIWRVALDIGMQATLSAKWLVPLLGVCAVGVVVGQVLVFTTNAWRRQELPLATALPIFIVCGVLTTASLLYLDRRPPGDPGPIVARPPSHPFAGLMAELSRRKLAGELPTPEEELSNEALPSERTSGAEDGLAWLCMPEAESLECSSGAPWEDVLACLPLPLPPKVAHVIAEPAPVVTAPVEAPVLQKPAPARAADRPFQVRLEIVHLAALLGVWLTSILIVQLVHERRARRGVAGASDDAATSPDELDTFSGSAPHELQTRDEFLRLELEAAREELARARESAQEALADEQRRSAEEIGRLQRELSAKIRELARSATEVERIQEFMRHTKENVVLPAASRVANASQSEPKEKGAGRDADASGEGSSYSVSSVQEERIGRRR